jgi:glycosyltransferase involved in cell wall biosynthesis
MKKLKIALIMQGDRGWMGGVEYIKNLILALGSLPKEIRLTFEVHLISREPLDVDLHKQLAPYVQQFYSHDPDLKPLTFLNRSRWFLERKLLKTENPRLETFLKKQRFDFIYPYTRATNGTSNYRSAAWITDFQHKYLPQFFAAKELYARDQIFESIAQASEIVVLSSKTAADDFKKFFPDRAHKARVLSFKTSPSPAWYDGDPQQVQHSYYLPNRFFIISNQFWQHKNHLMVFEALNLLKAKSITPIVVCTGHIYDYRKPDYSDTLLKSVHQNGLAHQVYFLGLIPKLDQVQLMRRSLAVIQPSLFEGWSTLVEEARSLGKTMILSDLPVNLEQDPPHSVFFDRNSPEQLAQRIQEHWLERSPGPDLEVERQARENSYAEVQAYGYHFLEIASSLMPLVNNSHLTKALRLLGW